ncbi:MAG: carbohydrate kinase [Bacteroidales bacterium]|nr:carbohydrate kinase [Bacteroidales bacterium]
MYFLGYDIGSSSVKASVINAETGVCELTAFYPKQEMEIEAKELGWAEQDPELWWANVQQVTDMLWQENLSLAKDVKAIGISYQMHGLVVVDKDQKAIRPAIIWCDSRAVEIGDLAFDEIGEEKCLSRLLNSPGNFTASKLSWVKENEAKTYQKIHKMMLPGDFIAMKMTGQINTTISGLSEGMLWDFKNHEIADFLLAYFGLKKEMIADIVPTFGLQAKLTKEMAKRLKLPLATPITYRAGDQPNNALSLNVVKPGEIAATAGTSGVVYGVSDQIIYDPLSRVNSFAHVNHHINDYRLGVLLCVNGTGILNSWLKNKVLNTALSYEQMNEMADEIPIGSDGLVILPFGNGAERILQNKELSAQMIGLDFNRHTNKHIIRAAHEGIAFAFKYGMDIMKGMAIDAKVIRAGDSNMFLSPIFRQTLANITSVTIELYDTDGSQGAARAAGIGLGYYATTEAAFSKLKKVKIISPNQEDKGKTEIAYAKWLAALNKTMQTH